MTYQSTCPHCGLENPEPSPFCSGCNMAVPTVIPSLPRVSTANEPAPGGKPVLLVEHTFVTRMDAPQALSVAWSLLSNAGFAAPPGSSMTAAQTMIEMARAGVGHWGAIPCPQTIRVQHE